MSSSTQPRRSTQVITLKPGEQFVLPPNAEITYVGDIPSFSSECQFDFDWTETCYRFAFENQPNAPVADAIIMSYIIDDVEFPLTPVENYQNYVNFEEPILTESIPLGLYTFVMTCKSSSNPRVVFKSIGTDIYLKVKNPTGHDSVGGVDTFFYIKAEKLTTCDCEGDLGDDVGLGT